MTLTRKTPLKRQASSMRANGDSLSTSPTHNRRSIRARKKPLKKLSRTSLKHKADRAFSLYIRERDKGCVIQTCGTDKNLQCAHLISRRYHSVRWDPDNAVTLCRRHHVYYTHRPLAWEDWIVDTFGRRFWSDLRHKAQQRWNGVYPEGWTA